MSVDDFVEGVVVPLLIFGVIGALALAPLIGVAMWFDSASCHATATKMGFESSWGVLQDCQIKTSDGWVPLRSYRKFADPK